MARHSQVRVRSSYNLTRSLGVLNGGSRNSARRITVTYLVFVLILIVVLFYIYIPTNIPGYLIPVAVIFLAIGTYFLYRLIRFFRQRSYFSSPAFQNQVSSLHSVIEEFNDLDNYISIKSFNEITQPYENRHLGVATYENISRWNINRQRNVLSNGRHAVSVSLQVVRRASQEPIKYLCKYFNIGTDEETLNRIEDLSSEVLNVEEGKRNLQKRLDEILSEVDPPVFIQKHYMKKLFQLLHFEGFRWRNISYPEYLFQYVSAGGNSAQRSQIILNPQNLDALVSYVAGKVKFAKSAAGQRALMTSTLRHQIKMRDRFTCQSCGISIQKEPHLLLEVDHIIPVSKGGLTRVENLQTLCWKCNRSKSSKIVLP